MIWSLLRKILKVPVDELISLLAHETALQMLVKKSLSLNYSQNAITMMKTTGIPQCFIYCNIYFFPSSYFTIMLEMGVIRILKWACWIYIWRPFQLKSLSTWFLASVWHILSYIWKRTNLPLSHLWCHQPWYLYGLPLWDSRDHVLP